jgi:cytochrome c6
MRSRLPHSRVAFGPKVSRLKSGGGRAVRINSRIIMKKIIALAIAAIAIPSTLVAADAKALYEKECSKCHGEDGKGQTKMGKKLGAKDYTDAKVQAEMKDDAAFKATKEGLKDKDGKTLMKPLEGATDDDIKALIAYMRAFKK